MRYEFLDKVAVGLCAMLHLMFVAETFAATPQAQLDFAAAQQAFIKGVEGDKKAVASALESFTALHVANPGQPLYTAYLGGAYGMKAGNAWMPWTKMRFADTCSDYLNKALRQLKPEHDLELVRGVPVSAETRLVAARVLLKMPKMLNRHEQGKQLVFDALKSPAFERTPRAVQAQFYRLAVGIANEDKDSVAAARWQGMLAASTSAPNTSIPSVSTQGAAK